MKKYILIIMTFVIALSAQVIRGENDTKKLDFSAEKKAMIIQTAQKVAKEIAPAIKTDGLFPVIFNHPNSEKCPKINKKAIIVRFMKDENDYLEFTVIETDPATKRPNGKATAKKRPNSILNVVMTEDSLEPLYVSDGNNRVLQFTPDYKTYRKNNPDKQLKPVEAQANVVY